MPNIPKPEKGLTLIEVMFAVLICAVAIIGGSLLFVIGRNHISLQERHRIAVQLAAQKLEELKTSDYYGIEEGYTYDNLYLEDLFYERRISTEDAGLYKKVTVNVQWSQLDKDRKVSLATFVAPQ